MSASSGAPGTAAAVRSTFIASRGYDWLLLVFSPLLALAFAELLPVLTDYPFERTRAFGGTNTRIGFFIGIFTSAHLVAVFFRSHGNRTIFAHHRLRFTVIPVALYLFLALSPVWVFVLAFVVAFFWDVYHSAMQNFGLCRIYDSKLGNAAEEGRRLDYWMNHVLYIGPIFLGPNLMAHAERVLDLDRVGWAGASTVVETVADLRQPIWWTAVLLGLAFCLWYVVRYWQLSRRGYRVSPHKIGLLVSVGITCTWAWGFLPPLEAFFVVNLFHAVQYLAIVWWMEKRTISRLAGLGRWSVKPAVALVVFLGVIGAYGVIAELWVQSAIQWLGSFALVCALMHFWYDGFIWSVRRREV